LVGLNFHDTTLADVKASDQAVFYPKNMAAHLAEQQVAFEIARIWAASTRSRRHTPVVGLCIANSINEGYSLAIASEIGRTSA
jgi:hypothetical protein